MTAAQAHRYERPADLATALRLLAEGPLQVLAGGTDLYARPGALPVAHPLLDIGALEELAGLQTQSGKVPTLKIGALTPWRTLARTPLPPGFEALSQAAREVGGIQVQNRGTLGGNLCHASPASDGLPPLLALDAQVELLSRIGRRQMPLSAFVVGKGRTARRPDELLVAVHVAFRSPRALSRFLKLGLRRYLNTSIATVAVAMDFDLDDRVTHCAIAVGACGPMVRRLPALEQALRFVPRRQLGASLERHLLPATLAHVSAFDDARASAGYRLEAAATMVRRAIGELAHFDRGLP